MKSQYIEAPDYKEIYRTRSIFLGGGITNCIDWQSEVIDAIGDLDLAILNPRRKSFTMDDPRQSEIQIKWEHYYLRRSNQVVFYFPHETLCPITLFELGATLERRLHTAPNDRQILFVGCHPDYQRKFDVKIQSELQGIEVCKDLKELVKKVLDFNQ